MKLFHRQYSEAGPPLVILHGLYGNQGNWMSLARQLAADYAVYAFDARNHGQSPWADTMALDEMAADVAETMTALGLHAAHVLGHSMGGKTAMRLALLQPDRVHSLVVVDIAPVDYHRSNDGVIQHLLALDLQTVRSRDDADAILVQTIPERSVRDFLLTNLQRGSEPELFRWRINLPVIARDFTEITGWEACSLNYPGSVLFIKGAESDYILAQYEQPTLRYFPAAQVKAVAGAGHWVHAEKPEALLRLVRNFI